MNERMTKEEFKKWLKARTRAFAVSVFKFVDELPNATSAKVISCQLAKSASSMGANYREATRAESGADFYPAPHAIRASLDPIQMEADELLRLFASIKMGCQKGPGT